MRIGIIGINHKSGDLILREEVSRAFTTHFKERHSPSHPFDFVLLSTCNRSELYFSAPDLATAHSELLAILRRKIAREFDHALYSYFGIDCFFHLAKVVSGFDSAILGETEIQGQVKRAYSESTAQHDLSSELHYLFQRSLRLGRRMRELIRLMPIDSLESTLWDIALSHFPRLAGCSILFIGASSINQKIATLFKAKGATNLTLCNRSEERGRLLADRENMRWLSWSGRSLMRNYEIVFLATKTPTFLITAPEYCPTDRQLLFDLGLPRNVDPAICDLHSLSLYNIDAVQARALHNTPPSLKCDFDTLQKLVSNEVVRFKHKLCAYSLYTS